MSKKKKKGFQWRMPQLSFRVKVVLTIVVVVVVCAAVLLVIMLVTGNLQPRTNEPGATKEALQQRDAKVKLAEQQGAILDSAKKALQEGNVSKANDIYTQAINAEPDATHKVQLAIDQSGLLYSFGKYNDAVTVAKKAESYSSDKFLAAYWLARLYEGGHQYSLAAQAYTLAGKWVTSSTNEFGFDKAYFTTRAAHAVALEQQ